MEITEIAKLAQAAAANHEALTSALNDEREAEAAVLTAAIDAAKPALGAVCSRIKKHVASTDGNNGCNPVKRIEYYEHRGLELVDDIYRRGDSSGNRGVYGGTRLYLLATGELAVATASGDWSRWQGEWDTLDIEFKAVTPREAMDTFELKECLESLSKALREQAEGKAPERAKAAKARAEKLRAMATLAAK